MKKLQRMLSLLLCAAMLLSLMGCQQGDATPTTETTLPPTETTEPPSTEPELLTDYREAVAAIESAASMTLEITSKKTISQAGEVFYEDTYQTLTCAGLDTDAPSYHSAMTVSHTSTYSVTYDETYVDGSVQLFINGAKYILIRADEGVEVNGVNISIQHNS